MHSAVIRSRPIRIQCVAVFEISDCCFHGDRMGVGWGRLNSSPRKQQRFKNRTQFEEVIPATTFSMPMTSLRDVRLRKANNSQSFSLMSGRTHSAEFSSAPSAEASAGGAESVTQQPPSFLQRDGSAHFKWLDADFVDLWPAFRNTASERGVIKRLIDSTKSPRRIALPG